MINKDASNIFCDTFSSVLNAIIRHMAMIIKRFAPKIAKLLYTSGNKIVKTPKKSKEYELFCVSSFQRSMILRKIIEPSNNSQEPIA